jgi:hypothetical protein
MTLQTTAKIIAIESGNVDLGDSTPVHARDSIWRVAGKYFGNLSTASVHFGQTLISSARSAVQRS